MSIPEKNIELQDKWTEIGFRRMEMNLNLRREFYSDYSKVFGEPCVSCTKKLPLYFNQLIGKTIMEICDYEFTNGRSRTLSRLGNVTYSNVNLTNEIGDKIVKEYPEQAKLWFKRMPKKQAAEVVEPEKESKPEAMPSDEFYNELVALPKIGDTIAKRITDAYATKEELKAGIIAGEVDVKPAVQEVLSKYIVGVDAS